MRQTNVVDHIRRFGVKVVLKEIIKHLEKSNDVNILELARDLHYSLRKFEKAEEGKKNA